MKSLVVFGLSTRYFAALAAPIDPKYSGLRESNSTPFLRSAKIRRGMSCIRRRASDEASPPSTTALM